LLVTPVLKKQQEVVNSVHTLGMATVMMVTITQDVTGMTVIVVNLPV
jgi:hypothetical protein